jgi:hypothetical protein
LRGSGAGRPVRTLAGMRHTRAAAGGGPQAPPPGRGVRAGAPAAFLAVVPHLPGFVPEASVVAARTAPPRHRVRVVLRYDLPDPPGPDLAAGIAAHAAGVLGAQR